MESVWIFTWFCQICNSNNWLTYGFYLTNPFKTKIMDKKYVYRNFGSKWLPQLNTGIFLEYTETNLFFEKNEFLYTFIFVWFKTKLCLELANSIFIWNSVIFFIATRYYFLGVAEKRLLHVMFFVLKKLYKSYSRCLLLFYLFPIKIQAKCFQITQENYDYSYTEGSISKVLLTLSI